MWPCRAVRANADVAYGNLPTPKTAWVRRKCLAHRAEQTTDAKLDRFAVLCVVQISACPQCFPAIMLERQPASTPSSYPLAMKEFLRATTTRSGNVRRTSRLRPYTCCGSPLCDSCSSAEHTNLVLGCLNCMCTCMPRVLATALDCPEFACGHAGRCVPMRTLRMAVCRFQRRLESVASLSLTELSKRPVRDWSDLRSCV